MKPPKNMSSFTSRCGGIFCGGTVAGFWFFFFFAGLFGFYGMRELLWGYFSLCVVPLIVISPMIIIAIDIIRGRRFVRRQEEVDDTIHRGTRYYD